MRNFIKLILIEPQSSNVHTTISNDCQQMMPSRGEEAVHNKKGCLVLEKIDMHNISELCSGASCQL